MKVNRRAVQRENPKYKIETVARYYANANAELGPDWSDVAGWTIPVGSPDPYEIGQWIGYGKYSDVFIGYRGNEKVALKVLKPVRPEKYKLETKILHNLRGGTNIVDLIEIVQNKRTKRYTMVMEYVPNVEYSDLYAKFTDHDTRYYLYQILKALQYCHSRGIMHRDVKPHNIVYDPETKKFALIDWGLAEFYHPGRKYNIHVASRNFKAIELLVDYQYYDYSVDIWSFGVTMACIIFGKMPFFEGSDDFDMVSKIIAVLGRDDFDAYLDKYGIVLPDELKASIGVTRRRKKTWEKIAQKGTRKHLCSPEAFDLLSKCLRYDHMERISAEEAMNHPYFDPVREPVYSVTQSLESE